MKLKRALTVLLIALLTRVSAPAQVTATLLLPVGADSVVNSHYLNFYFGALMAARDFSQDSLRLNLEVVDVLGRDFPTFANRMQMLRSDVIIGPVSQKDIQRVLSILPEGKFIVSPLDTKTEGMCDTLPVILANTPQSRQVDDAIDWILEDFSRDTVLALSDTILKVYEQDRFPSETEYHIMNRLRDSDSTVSCSYRISQGVEAIDTFNVYCHLGDTVTRVFAVTDRDIFAKDVMRQTMEQNYKGKNTFYYGTGKVRSSELEDLCAARTHMSTTFFVDYTDPRVQNFILQYRAFFAADPDSFSFHGYDTLHYFVSLCALYGSNWREFLGFYSESGLQTDFAFPSDCVQVGSVNQAVRRVLYSGQYNYTIVRK